MNEVHDSSTMPDPERQAEATRVDRAARLPVVLQVLPSLDIGGGGVERSAIDVAEALVLAGKPAIVVSEGGSQVVELERRGARHIELPLASKNPLVICRNIRRLRDVVEQESIELVHARSRAPAWSARSAARQAGVPFVTTFHGTYNFGTSLMGDLKKRYNAVMTDADAVIANSQFIADHIAKNYGLSGSKVHVVPRGVDTASFDAEGFNLNRTVDAATKWRLPDDSALVLLPARLTRWKGQLLFIDALARLKSRRGANNFNVTGLLVGSDQGRESYRCELEDRIEELGLGGNVRIVGHCDDMPAAYMLSDVVVSASTDPEAFGRIVAEAQAMGRPVVVADHGGAAEQVIDGVTGWRFEPGNPDKLADALETALALDVRSRTRLAEHASKHARSKYAKNVMCASTLRVYASVYESDKN